MREKCAPLRTGFSTRAHSDSTMYKALTANHNTTAYYNNAPSLMF